jgi:maleylacetoacetate isomerase
MTSTLRFELFSFWRTSATYRVRVALNLKGLTAQERFIDVDAGENRGEAFLAINPLGGLPAFIDHEPGGSDRAPITQSLAILEYLEEIQPIPPLLPRSAAERARVRSLALMMAADTHPLVTPRVKKYLMADGKFHDVAWRDWQIHWFGTGLKALEQRLSTEKATGKFAHGDSVTIADICLASVIAVARVFKIEVPDIPTVNRVMAACEELEAFQRAEPNRQAGAPRAL